MTITDTDRERVIQDEHHVVRYLSRNKWCPRVGRGIQPEAFMSEKHPDKPISTYWLEFFGQDVWRSLECICCTTDYQGMKENGRFLKLNVGEVRKIKIESKQNVTVIHDGEDRVRNKSHASISPPEKDVFVALATHAREYGQLLEVPPNCYQFDN